jgi:transposase
MIDRILPGFAALDLGATRLFAATAEAPVRSFGTFSAELRALAQWLQEHHVRAVAMEATGVYWIPVHDLLQREGFQVTLFHGAHARNLPGRKSDVRDCQWHAMLHSHGLLRACFIPPEPIRQLRSFYRLREDHLEMAAAHVAHMQRALDLMNVGLHRVLSQLHGVSGLRVLDAILAGERDPAALAALCDEQILRKKKAQVLQSLEGDWQPHHLFALRQALEAYRFYHRQIATCDTEVEALLQTLNATRPSQMPKAGQKVKIVRHNTPQIANLHGLLLTFAEGRDATLLPGISPLGWMKLTGEVGTDLSAFATEHHFVAWAGLAPQLHQSGARHRRRPRPKTKVGQIFREAAMSLAKSKHLALGGFYRRLKGRRGAAIAIVATARKLAILFYRVLTRGLDYVERGLAQYEAHYRAQSERHLRKCAARLGFLLQPRIDPLL